MTPSRRLSRFLCLAGLLQIVVAAAAGTAALLGETESNAGEEDYEDATEDDDSRGTDNMTGVFGGLPAFSGLRFPSPGHPLIRRPVVSPGAMRTSQDGQRARLTIRMAPREAAARRAWKTKSILQDNLIIRGMSRTKMQHAVTLVETKSGDILASWFGGVWEGTPDVSIFIARYKKDRCIRSRKFCGGRWGRAIPLIKPIRRIPTWNPVFCQHPKSKELLLFYKVGRTPQVWQGRLLRSLDDGRSWEGPEILPRGISGPAKNKCLYNDDGVLLAGSSAEAGLKNTKTLKWTSHVEYSPDNGRTWNRTDNIRFKGRIIQPSLLKDSKGNIRMLIRQRGELIGQRYYNSSVVLAVSDRTGLTWPSTARSTNLPCPNSGIDAVTLPDGRMLIVYNDGLRSRFNGRGKMAVATSSDDGESWKQVMVLVDAGLRLREYSYPAVYLASDGMVHIGFTWSIRAVRPRHSGRENIKHIVLDPALL